ncbi:MAG: antibiotic biosynthesis monooxygenase [Iphinoe sp. HA4291-MV1]|jgi:quinol monooxygenase YgiN|nr:antibiotic biosynthesis monooxygenase [Iphinoe sp. HA4291-MV1]
MKYTFNKNESDRFTVVGDLRTSIMMTLVNVFTVFPDKQKDTLWALHKIYKETVRHQPGFISARLLISDDGTKVTVLALWDSQQQLATIKQIPRLQNFHNSELLEAVISSDAHVYSTFIEVPGALHKHRKQKTD